MNILIYSRVFLPSFGGLEQMMHMIAVELARAGHAVTVMTETPGGIGNDRRYKVVRRPGRAERSNAVSQADVCILANLPLRFVPYITYALSRVVVIHHGIYWPESRFSIKHALIMTLLRIVAANISCSRAVAEKLSTKSIIIPNCYDDSIFTPRVPGERRRDIIFVGRVVSDKGCQILVEAFSNLIRSGMELKLTIVGDGPELPKLKQLAQSLDIDACIEFTGRVNGENLASMLGRHRIIAIPSIVEEGFGIVTLEGIACGCVAIGSDGGGLPEAIGPCGLVVPRGDVNALTDGLRRLLTDDALVLEFRQAAPEHLRAHSRAKIGAQYTGLIEAVVLRSPASRAHN